MRSIADLLGVSLDAVIYFMRHFELKRRTFSEISKIKFENKKPSFKEKKINSIYEKELRAIGVMLYWGEGYKTNKSTCVDFANSDPEMIDMFVKYLNNTYELQKSKFRVLLYCYSDQNIKDLIDFWSKLTKIPKNQFTKPYVRKDFRQDGRKMKHGLVHIRYHDKKLLLNIKNYIDFYKNKFLGIKR